MKTIIRSLARARGLEIARLDRFGRSPSRDIQKIFGDATLQVIFDVGANEGQSAREFAVDHPNAAIHCFEPYEEAYRKLQDLASRNPRIRTTKCALGQIPGSQTLWTNSASVTNSLLPNSPVAEGFQPAGMIRPTGGLATPVLTVDSYCQDTHVDFIDLLKIDTQGYDLRVIQGAEKTISRGGISLIFVEVLFASLYVGQNYFHEIYDHLWTRNFRLVNFYAMARTETRHLSWCDALFLHPDVLAGRLTEPTRRLPTSRQAPKPAAPLGVRRAPNQASRLGTP